MAKTDQALSHGDRPAKQPHGSGDRNKDDNGVSGSDDNESTYAGSQSPKATKHTETR